VDLNVQVRYYRLNCKGVRACTLSAFKRNTFPSISQRCILKIKEGTIVVYRNNCLLFFHHLYYKCWWNCFLFVFLLVFPFCFFFITTIHSRCIVLIADFVRLTAKKSITPVEPDSNCSTIKIIRIALIMADFGRLMA